MNDNSGRLAKNERKEKETHPDLKGSATIGGVEFWISGWSKVNDKGKWLSLSFQRKDEEKPANARQAAPRDAGIDEPW